MRQRTDEVDALQAHAGNTATFPMAILNGYLTRKRNRLSPENDEDSAPREFRRFVNASGAQDVQISNGLWRRTGQGLRKPIAYADWLYAALPIIPGQQRDDFGGKHKHGIDPLSYRALWEEGPGSQPSNPGGPRMMAGEYIWNPGTS